MTTTTKKNKTIPATGIKIVANNSARICDELNNANGTATAHTYWRYSQIEQLTEDIEQQLLDLGLPKGLHKGAAAVCMWGDAVANSYKYHRKSTQVLIVRRSTGWYLTNVDEGGVYTQGGFTSLHITQSQEDEIVKRMRKKYTLIPTEG